MSIKRSILLRPILSEKSTRLGETQNKYVFQVEKQSNKLEIKKAIEEMYGVTVEKVRTMNCLGKPRSKNTKSGVVSGRTNSFKKAIVTLTEGDTVDFYSNI